MRFSSKCAAIAAILLFSATAAQAEDLPAGFVLNAQTIDKAKAATFEGRSIAGMLPEKMEWQIRNTGLQMTLKSYEPWVLAQKYVDYTKQNVPGKVRIAEGSKGLVGWEAGIPFPEIDPADPQAGEKVIWNMQLAQPIGCYQSQSPFAYVMIDGDSGIERNMRWRFSRIYMQGRWCDPNGKLVLGDGTLRTKDILVALEPFDLRGTGLLNNGKVTGEPDKSWAYMRSVRRIRTLSGGSWMDPVGGGTDMVNDDLEIFNAHPTWYKSIKYLGKRWVLSPANTRWPHWVSGGSDSKAEFPTLDLANKPYWNMMHDYEPREVHVVETIPPDEHPYGKKIIYVEVQAPLPRYTEIYDKRGEFWKFGIWADRMAKDAGGNPVVYPAAGNMVDFKRNHASLFYSPAVSVFNDPAIGEDDLSVGVLEKIGGN